MNHFHGAARRLVEKRLSVKQRRLLKEVYCKFSGPSLRLNLRKHSFRIKTKIIKRYFSYAAPQLERKLRAMGLTKGDTVLMHSSFRVHNGFRGNPQQVVDSVLTIIGPTGNLLMVSMPYTGSSLGYLKDRPVFDVRRTASRMGIISELFRTGKNVLRSLSPSHPILALGPKAEWITEDHEKTMYPCGKGSPFEKILTLNAKALFFDMSPKGISTFFHHLEDTFKEHLSVKLYDDEPLEATVIDPDGNRINVKSYVFSEEARATRNAASLRREMLKNGGIRNGKIGNTRLALVDLNNAVYCARRIITSGRCLY